MSSKNLHNFIISTGGSIAGGRESTGALQRRPTAFGQDRGSFTGGRPANLTKKEFFAG